MTLNATFVEMGAEMVADFGVSKAMNARFDSAPIGAVASKITSVFISASAWEGANGVYSQVVDVEGATEKSQINLTPSAEQLAIFYDKSLALVTENEDGIVTVYAIGQKPENDYTIQATITEVSV